MKDSINPWCSSCAKLEPEVLALREENSRLREEVTKWVNIFLKADAAANAKFLGVLMISKEPT